MATVTVLTSGCSFTHAPDSWANHLKKRYRVLNVAQGGGGNEMNMRNFVQTWCEYNPDVSILQLTGTNRFELIVDKAIQQQDGDHEQAVITKEDYTWIKSSGDINWWKDRDIAISNAIDNYIKHCHSDTLQLVRLLSGIVTLQRLCGKNFKIFCWKEIFSNKMIEMIKSRKELAIWYGLIDWTRFWFHDKTKGLCEWGIDNGFTGNLEEDRINKPPKGYIEGDFGKQMIGHPSAECHEAFAEQVVEQWIKHRHA